MPDDPGDDDAPAPHGIFGLKSPGFVLSIVVVVGLFAALLAAAWWSGAFDCHNFKSCPQLQR